MIYTNLGKRVMDVWQTIPSYHPLAEIIAAEAMPDHFHGLLHLLPENREHLGRIINGFMIACTHEYWDTLGIDWRNMTKRTDIDQRAAALEWQDAYHLRSLRGPALFVRGYNDVEALTPEQVETKCRYISEQARRALIKGSMRECFHIHRDSTARSWTFDSLHQAFLHDRFYASAPQHLEPALAKIRQRIHLHPQSGKPTLDYLGSTNLITAPRKLPLICHRSDAPFFEQQKAAIIQAARQGAVIVSAFISPKEREIKKQLLIEFLPIIEVADNGFADRYKPKGNSFYACAENRLLQITPWTYEYHRNTQVTREMCMVMNQLVRAISGMPDDWWKS